jgi:putative oxidoreductase
MCLYLVVVSVLPHNFWAVQGMAAGGMQTQFLKNVGIMRGLLMIAAHGPGKWSVDEVQAPAILSHRITSSPH